MGAGLHSLAGLRKACPQFGQIPKRRLLGADGGVLLIRVVPPLSMAFPGAPVAGTKLPVGSEKVPNPSTTLLSTTKVPVKMEPGIVPDRLISVTELSLSKKLNGPGS